MVSFLNWLIGAIVWAAANVIYIDKRLKGSRRGRVLSFLVGWPGTLLAMFLVSEGRSTKIEPPPDDDERLLREVRVDRELRSDAEF